MNHQDFKALLDALNRIERAINDKNNDRVVNLVNRLAVVLRMMKTLHKTLIEVNEIKTAEIVLGIMKTYTKIAGEALNENS